MAVTLLVTRAGRPLAWWPRLLTEAERTHVYILGADAVPAGLLGWMPEPEEIHWHQRSLVVDRLSPGA